MATKQINEFDEQNEPNAADRLLIQENTGDAYKHSSIEDVTRCGTAEILSGIAALNQDISATYVEAEVQAISDKVDAILAALQNTSSS